MQRRRESVTARRRRPCGAHEPAPSWPAERGFDPRYDAGPRLRSKTIFMPYAPFRLIPVLLFLGLAGCATLPDEPRQPGATEALAAALKSGDCRESSDLAARADTVRAGDRLALIQICLQRGDFLHARHAAADFLAAFPDHPDSDYAAYLHAVAGFGQWSRAYRVEPDAVISEGRKLFLEMAGYLRERPLSEYVEELAPRMIRLREGIAGAELALAERARRHGELDEARARADYVVQYYPRTQAAADAARLLMALTDE